MPSLAIQQPFEPIGSRAQIPALQPPFHRTALFEPDMKVASGDLDFDFCPQPHNRLASVLIGKELGGYKITESLGIGGMAEVFKGHDVSGKLVAIKLTPTIGISEGVIDRFKQEAKVTRDLIKHNNILSTYSFGEENSFFYLVMELADNGSLREYMDRKMKFAEGKYKPLERDDLVLALAYITQVLDGVTEIHSKGIIHRDIKPPNILFVGSTPKLADFGLVSEVQATQHFTRTGQGLGTALYIAPEQAFNAKQASELSDLYSIGAMLYELTTGYPPFRGETSHATMAKHRTEKPIPPKDKNPNISDQLNRIIMDLLIKEPDKRAQRFRIPGYHPAQVLKDRLFRATIELYSALQ